MMTGEQVFFAADTALNAGKPSEAYELLGASAREGYSYAFNSIGYMLEHGLGVRPNRRAALFWYYKGEEPAISVRSTISASASRKTAISATQEFGFCGHSTKVTATPHWNWPACISSRAVIAFPRRNTSAACWHRAPPPSIRSRKDEI